MMIDVRFSTKAKRECLKGGFPIDYLKKAIQEELEGKIMDSLDDNLYISVIYGKKPIMAIGRQFDDLFLVDDVNLKFVLIHASDDGEPVIHRPEYEESEEYLALKEIRDRDELLSSPIECLDISTRIFLRLSKCGFRTIGDIIEETEEYFKDNKILTLAHISELRGRLLGLNLGFKKEEDHE
jgi:hypothetical protein